MKSDVLTISLGKQDLHVEFFDIDKELPISIEDKSADETKTVWLSPNQVNYLISHLADKLKLIREPVDLLSAK